MTTAPDRNDPRRPLPFMTGMALQAYHPAEHGLEAARAQGYTHAYFDLSLPGESPADWDGPRRAAAKKAIAATGIRPICHGNFKLPLASDVRELGRAAVACVKKEIELAAEFGAPLIEHGGGLVEPRLVQEARRRGRRHLIDNLNELVDYARGLGVPVWLENLCNYDYHPFYYQVTAEEEYAQVLDEVPGLGFFLDVSHAHVNGGAPLKVFRRFHGRVVGMSFSDNSGERDSHLPLGRGSIDYRGLLAAVDECGWRGVIGFETRGGTLEDNLRHLRSLHPS